MSKSDVIEVEGVVVEKLPSAMFRKNASLFFKFFYFF